MKIEFAAVVAVLLAIVASSCAAPKKKDAPPPAQGKVVIRLTRGLNDSPGSGRVLEGERRPPVGTGADDGDVELA